MLDDQRYTRRVTEFKQPGTCLNCHASTYVTMKKLGGGDIFKGFEQINHMSYLEATQACEASCGLHRLPRSAEHGPPGDAAGIY